MKTKLNPCPFCGGEARMYTASEFDGDYAAVECLNCEVEMLVREFEYNIDNEDLAIKQWNSRACTENYWRKYPDEKPESGTHVFSYYNDDPYYLYYSTCFGEHFRDLEEGTIFSDGEREVWWHPIPSPPPSMTEEEEDQ